MLDKVIIKVIGATKIYKGDIVLDDVNVSFETGNIHGIIGRNGSGKTVLFKCICGLTPPTRGKILITDKEIGKDIDIPDNIGVIIENPGFLPNYSGYENQP